MRFWWCAAAFLLLSFSETTFLTTALASTSLPEDLTSRSELLDSRNSLTKRDDHEHHNHNAAPLLELNETEITMHHSPTPPSYYTIDWEDTTNSETRHPGLIISHAVFMCLAFFVALPIGITLRSVRHAGHPAATVAFYGLSALGCAMSGIYTKLTPNMYEGNKHGSHGYILLLLALSLSAIDFLAAIKRAVEFIRDREKKSIKRFWKFVILNKENLTCSVGPEYDGLVVGDPEDFENAKLSRSSSEMSHVEIDDVSNTAQWANGVQYHRRQSSLASDRTLFGRHSPTYSEDTLEDSRPIRTMKRKKGLAYRIGQYIFTVLERVLVVAGLAMLLTGIVEYTGGCREIYENGCLAHLIKGAIFWSYGLLTFARFLGSFAEFGWAWNRSPRDAVSAEFVESFVIFLYGATNTWMERFGAKPGDPFTTKQIQHISIAVMFCFAGLVGMGIESKLVRKWLASSTFSSTATLSDMPQDAVTEPQSYLGSFNPFPALVIGVTGAAMAAHAQTYLFQVQIHALWGNLLVAFAVLRCLTYFFLWLGPPRSILPSRPPTEALGSFFLACGGLVFMFSTEEVTIAAMRRGRDDVMMFLNVAVAITCFAFCWTLSVVAFKGWLKSHSHSTVTYRSVSDA